MTDFISGMRDAGTAALAGQDVEMPFRSALRPRPAAAGRAPARCRRRASTTRRCASCASSCASARAATRAAYGPEVVGCDAHRALALEAARKGIVLLKNEAGLLPLAGVRPAWR